MNPGSTGWNPGSTEPEGSVVPDAVRVPNGTTDFSRRFLHLESTLVNYLGLAHTPNVNIQNDRGQTNMHLVFALKQILRVKIGKERDKVPDAMEEIDEGSTST